MENPQLVIALCVFVVELFFLVVFRRGFSSLNRLSKAAAVAIALVSSIAVFFQIRAVIIWAAIFASALLYFFPIELNRSTDVEKQTKHSIPPQPRLRK